MNLLFRIMTAFYAFVSTIVWGFIMICPFGDKVLMENILDSLHITFYQSNQYDVLIFIMGFVFFCLNFVVLFSGIRGKRGVKYISNKNDAGEVRISTNSVENIAFALSKRFQGVKETKARVHFKNEKVYISMKVTTLPDVKVPELCKSMQNRIKESVETSMGLTVADVKVSIEGVAGAVQE